jgi:hypothetical protein
VRKTEGDVMNHHYFTAAMAEQHRAELLAAAEHARLRAGARPKRRRLSFALRLHLPARVRTRRRAGALRELPGSL